MDEALLEQQREAYAVAGVDESEPAQPRRKRKNSYTNGEEVRNEAACHTCREVLITPAEQ